MAPERLATHVTRFVVVTAAASLVTFVVCARTAGAAFAPTLVFVTAAIAATAALRALMRRMRAVGPTEGRSPPT